MKMTSNLKCLQVGCYTSFLNDNSRRVDDSSLTVSDLPPLCQKVRLCKDGEVKEEFYFGNQRFVFIKTSHRINIFSWNESIFIR